MRQFNFDEALNGAKICTRIGQKAIIEDVFLDKSFSAKIKFNRRYMKITYGLDGSFHGDIKISSPYDLMMADDKKGGNE